MLPPIESRKQCRGKVPEISLLVQKKTRNYFIGLKLILFKNMENFPNVLNYNSTKSVKLTTSLRPSSLRRCGTSGEGPGTRNVLTSLARSPFVAAAPMRACACSQAS